MLFNDFYGCFYFVREEGPKNNNKNNNTHVYFKERAFGNQRWMDSFP
jgi:hypothetical protein